jgi:hypothetical protein
MGTTRSDEQQEMSYYDPDVRQPGLTGSSPPDIVPETSTWPIMDESRPGTEEMKTPRPSIGIHQLPVTTGLYNSIQSQASPSHEGAFSPEVRLLLLSTIKERPSRLTGTP